ncbi:hypothetical protein KSF78_0001698 [Schistosoma japonicum]|nr:hypothetical protein KSF78_0001698 [Schistosoma japonicum]
MLNLPTYLVFFTVENSFKCVIANAKQFVKVISAYHSVNVLILLRLLISSSMLNYVCFNHLVRMALIDYSFTISALLKILTCHHSSDF